MLNSCMCQGKTKGNKRQSMGLTMYVQCMYIIWDVVLHPAVRVPWSSILFPDFKQTSLSPLCTKHFRRMCQLCPTKEG